MKTNKIIFNSVMKVIYFLMIIMRFQISSAETIAQPPVNFTEIGAGKSADNPYYISTLANLRWLSENESAWGDDITTYYYQQKN